MSQMTEECKSIFESINKKLARIATKKDVKLIRGDIALIQNDITLIAKKLLRPDEQRELHSARDVKGEALPLAAKNR